MQVKYHSNVSTGTEASTYDPPKKPGPYKTNVWKKKKFWRWFIPSLKPWSVTNVCSSAKNPIERQFSIKSTMNQSFGASFSFLFLGILFNPLPKFMDSFWRDTLESTRNMLEGDNAILLSHKVPGRPNYNTWKWMGGTKGNFWGCLLALWSDVHGEMPLMVVTAS